MHTNFQRTLSVTSFVAYFNNRVSISLSFKIHTLWSEVKNFFVNLSKSFDFLCASRIVIGSLKSTQSLFQSQELFCLFQRLSRFLSRP
jgi:hypothetical protein